MAANIILDPHFSECPCTETFSTFFCLFLPTPRQVRQQLITLPQHRNAVDSHLALLMPTQTDREDRLAQIYWREGKQRGSRPTPGQE